MVFRNFLLAPSKLMSTTLQKEHMARHAHSHAHGHWRNLKSCEIIAKIYCLLTVICEGESDYISLVTVLCFSPNIFSTEELVHEAIYSHKFYGQFMLTFNYATNSGKWSTTLDSTKPKTIKRACEISAIFRGCLWVYSTLQRLFYVWEFFLVFYGILNVKP